MPNLSQANSELTKHRATGDGSKMSAPSPQHTYQVVSGVTLVKSIIFQRQYYYLEILSSLLSDICLFPGLVVIALVVFPSSSSTSFI